MADLQAQLSLQNKLLQSIKDEIGGLKRAFALAEKSREDRFEAALKKLRGDFELRLMDVLAASIVEVADDISKDSLRIQAIMDHLGLPDVEFDE